jgi:hypothetical protein
MRRFVDAGEPIESMQRTAAGLTLWIEGTTIDGKQKSVRSPHVGKTGKGAITLLWAFGLLL